MEQGKLSEESYRKELYAYIRKIVDDARERQKKLAGFEDDSKTGIVCPVCKKEIIRTNWGYNCVSKECLSINYKFAGKNLNGEQIEGLLKTGRTSLIKGFISAKTGNKYNAKLFIKTENGKAKIGFEFK